MQLQRYLFLLTFVVGNLALSSPHSDAPAQVKSNDDSAEAAPADQQKTENLAITEPSPLPPASLRKLVNKFNKSEYYYPYKQELMVHIGAVWGVKDSSDSKQDLNGLIGFSYLFPKRFSPKWEAGVDLSTAGQGHLHLSQRNIINEKGSFRPFYSYGIMNKIVPDQELASFSNWDNYLVRFGFGLEDILRPPRSVILDLYAAAGTKDVLVMFTYGYSWGF